MLHYDLAMAGSLPTCEVFYTSAITCAIHQRASHHKSTIGSAKAESLIFLPDADLWNLNEETMLF